MAEPAGDKRFVKSVDSIGEAAGGARFTLLAYGMSVEKEG
jgi:hypothetical protein